jgi:trk system potassium uptake protein
MCKSYKIKISEAKFQFKEKIFRLSLQISDIIKPVALVIKGIGRFFFTINFFLFILGFIFYFGFENSPATLDKLHSAFRVSFLILFITRYLPELLSFKKSKGISYILNLLIFIFALFVLLVNFKFVNYEKKFWELFNGNPIIIVTIFLIGFSEISALKQISLIKVPPALVFASSFFLIIIIGSGLLLLPRAHIGQLSYLDSLFTSVSAVCVTGLVVVDTATNFTTVGKNILLCLIQTGGLGIMTFTGFFSYIFTASGSSFRDKLLLSEIFSSESMNNLFKLLTKIIMLTFLTEIAGAVIIYNSLDWQVQNKVMFSIFHSVSAFCNAGFSTLTEGLFSPVVRFNNSVQLSVAVLIILGGIGFPVLTGFYSFCKHMAIVLLKKIQRNRMPVKPAKRNISTRIVLFMTAFLIFTGTILYYVFESKNSLIGIDNTQKIIASFFGSISARTAGFNMVDLSRWSYPTVFLMILLMWIGASPGSTGGGIKTTTFALAFRSVWSNIRGRDSLRIGNREIGSKTITKVLSVIFLSIMIILTGFFCLLISEPGKNPVHLLFECVSAFSTVGLSLAHTGSLSETGKIVIIFLMFIGRVGPLTFFTGIMLSHQKKYARFPELEIIIN